MRRLIIALTLVVLSLSGCSHPKNDPSSGGIVCVMPDGEEIPVSPDVLDCRTIPEWSA